MLRRRWVAVAVCCAALLTGCTSPPPTSASAPAGRPAAVAPATPAPSGAPLTVAALGDSLSRGFDACARYGDCTAVSWSTGTDPRVGSIASRLSALRRAPVRRVNEARSGAESDDLARQAALVEARDPDLVTLLVGANDVCRATTEQMTPATTYAGRVARTIGGLSRALPGATLLVASVPNVTALLPAAADDATARFLWSRAGACATALQDPRSTSAEAAARRAAVRSRIAAYNASLRVACAQQPRCVYDGGALNAYRPEAEQLSALDAFHPSVAGLTRLAALQWTALERSGLLPG